MAKKSNKNGKKSRRTLPKKQNKRRGAGNASAGAMSNQTNPTFGSVSTINTAPVAIGNSLRGFQSQVVHTSTGCRVVGRDYAFTVAATGTVTGWCCAGGLPMTPAAMPATILRNFVQMYNNFKIRKIYVHYITSSPTSQAGDIVFYYQKNTNDPLLNCTDSTFLPFVLSDSQTVIGPQWTNHTVTLTPVNNWKGTDYGEEQSLSELSAGDVFIFSKTSSSNSPGYVIFDYDIEFRNLSVNPRWGIIPSSEALWQQIAAVSSTVVGTANIIPAQISSLSTTGLGATTITNPTLSVGHIYKFCVDITNSTFTTPNTSGAQWAVQTGGVAYGGVTSVAGTVASTNTNLAPKDGFTCYIAVDSSTAGVYFPTFEAAVSGYGAITYQSVATYNTIVRGFIKWVGYQAGGGNYSSQ